MPDRIVLIRPCCIGDVVLATAALRALRRQWPEAHITWAVGGWSQAAIASHDALDAVLDTGPAANPAAGLRGVWRMARLLRAGDFDLMVSLVRSPWMSLAALLSGIPQRAGIDSGGRGFGYTLRVPVDPAARRHEAEIYLDVVRALGVATDGITANVPVFDADRAAVRDRVGEGRILVINPAGGSNPGMVMDAKRWPPAHFAVLANALAAELAARVVLVGGPGDRDLLDAVAASLVETPQIFAGSLTFPQIAALAREAVGYVGNDTGLTHLAAAAGGRTVMILGPSDPERYGPFAEDALAVWKPAALRPGGVAAGGAVEWDWARDGISVDDALDAILPFLRR